MDGYECYPPVQLVREIDQVFRIVEQRLDQHPEETDQDGHLDDQRSKAAYRVYPAFAVQPHRFLGYALPVASISLLNLPYLWLQPGHGPHLAQLTHRQRDGDHPHQHREEYDRQPHLRKAQDIQHQKGVEHGADDDLSPEITEYGENLH